MFKNNYIGFWSQSVRQQPVIEIPVENYLTRTKFDTWEGRYFFDTHFTGTVLRDQTYLQADINEIILSLNVPTSYKVENFDGTMEEIGGYYVLTKKLSSGESFNIILKNPDYESISKTTSFAIPLLIGFVLGYFGRKFF